MTIAMAAPDRGMARISPELQVSETGAGANVTVAAIDGAACAAGLGDGRVLRIGEAGGETVARHGGAVTGLALGPDGAILSTGQDGTLMRDGAPVFRARDEAWITGLACTRDTVAVAYGRSVAALGPDGEMRARFDAHPSTVAGIAVSPDGTRVAAARYNGVSVWSLTDLADPLDLPWRGSLTGVSWSPDGRFVAAATQDREMHVWDLVTGRDFRLGGYARKVRQIGWTEDGDFLFSTGADVVVAWPLAADPGTMPPVEIGFAHAATASAVATRGRRDMVAAGFTNGSVVIGECARGTAKIGRAADGDAITALAWEPTTDVAFYGTSRGRIGLIRPA